jgi:hypothetical protein
MIEPVNAPPPADLPAARSARLREALTGTRLASSEEYQVVATAVRELDRDAIAWWASRWRDLSADDLADIVADWSANFAGETHWHHTYVPISDGVAHEGWARAVDTFEAVLAQLARLGLSVPDHRAEAFISNIGMIDGFQTWPPEQRASFVASLVGKPDTYAALLLFVSAAMLSDAKDLSPTAMQPADRSRDDAGRRDDPD